MDSPIEERLAGDLFLERLLRVIDEGRRTTTYKLALVMALMECAALNPGQDVIATRDIAREALTLYFRMSRPFVPHAGPAVRLSQIKGRGTWLPKLVALRESVGDAVTIEQAKELNPNAYRAALDEVESTFVRYPIPLLQVVGGDVLPFIYHQDWPELASVRSLRRQGRDHVRLLPGAGVRLVVLGPMLRPLIEGAWERDVRRRNGIDSLAEQLHSHMFGAARTSFPRILVDGLAEIQEGRCFYCRRRVQRRSVDHVLPWSRWPNDAVENLVLTDVHCNTSKSDSLAALRHVDTWQERNMHQAEHLIEIAGSCRWLSDPTRVAALATSTYAHLAVGTPLWDGPQSFVRFDGAVPWWMKEASK